MIYAPNMILIGAAERDAGKTVFACELVSRFATTGVIAAKVTAIRENNGICPRGGQGCGVCSSLEGPYCLTEELATGGTKDTQRLLASGAKHVYWLRVLKEHLESGARMLLETIGRDALVICESNSLRHVVEPGLFFMLRRHGTRRAKASAEAVSRYADVLANSDGSRFDIDFERVGVADNRWTYRFPATAVILASAPGPPRKPEAASGHLLTDTVFDQLRFHFDDIIAAVPHDTHHDFPNTRTIPCIHAGTELLADMLAALQAADTELRLVISCDLPRLDIRWIRRLFRVIGDRDAAVSVSAEGHTSPLFALFRPSAVMALCAAYNAGKRSLREALAACNVAYVPWCAGNPSPGTGVPDGCETFAVEPEK